MISTLDPLATLEWDTEADLTIAREMFTRLRMVLPHATQALPHDGRLDLQAYGIVITMVLSERPWFQVEVHSSFRMQFFAHDWHIDSPGIIQWNELQKAQEFCDNMMHVWEQVIISFEHADRID